MPPPSEIVIEQLDTFLTNQLLAMIEEHLLTMIDVGVTYETYTAALVPILIGAASALSDITDTEAGLIHCERCGASVQRSGRPPKVDTVV
jgi:hypothetical protein